MIKNRLAFLFFGCMLVANVCHAQINVTDFLISETTVSFDISGTLPSPAPANLEFALIFSNPDPFALPGFVLEDFVSAFNVSFTGTQFLDPVFPASTGGESFGDYFFFLFADDRFVGEEIKGSFDATWDAPVFDPSAVNSLEMYWGAATDQGPVNSGTLLTAVPVPEPDGALLLLMCLPALHMLFRR